MFLYPINKLTVIVLLFSVFGSIRYSIKGCAGVGIQFWLVGNF